MALSGLVPAEASDLWIRTAENGSSITAMMGYLAILLPLWNIQEHRCGQAHRAASSNITEKKINGSMSAQTLDFPTSW